MKRFYKVYAQGAINPYPVQKLSTSEAREALGEAADYQATTFIERGYGDLDSIPEARAIKAEIERIRAAQEAEEITDQEADEAETEKVSALQELVYKLWDKGESIGCGDWGLVQVEGDEEPSRPCKW